MLYIRHLTQAESEWVNHAQLYAALSEPENRSYFFEHIPNPPDGLEAQKKYSQIIDGMIKSGRLNRDAFVLGLFDFAEKVRKLAPHVVMFDNELRLDLHIHLCLVLGFRLARS